MSDLCMCDYCRHYCPCVAHRVPQTSDDARPTDTGPRTVPTATERPVDRTRDEGGAVSVEYGLLAAAVLLVVGGVLAVAAALGATFTEAQPTAPVFDDSGYSTDVGYFYAPPTPAPGAYSWDRTCPGLHDTGTGWTCCSNGTCYLTGAG